MVFVFRDDCAGRDLLSKEQKMLRATGFRSDLKEKFTGWRGKSLARTPRASMRERSKSHHDQTCDPRLPTALSSTMTFCGGSKRSRCFCNFHYLCILKPPPIP